MEHRFRPRLEALEGRWLLSTLSVTNNLDSGPGSLRASGLRALRTNSPQGRENRRGIQAKSWRDSGTDCAYQGAGAKGDPRRRINRVTRRTVMSFFFWRRKRTSTGARDGAQHQRAASRFRSGF